MGDSNTQLCKSESISMLGTLMGILSDQWSVANKNDELIKIIETEVGVITVAEDSKMDVRSV